MSTKGSLHSHYTLPYVIMIAMNCNADTDKHVYIPPVSYAHIAAVLAYRQKFLFHFPQFHSSQIPLQFSWCTPERVGWVVESTGKKGLKRMMSKWTDVNFTAQR